MIGDARPSAGDLVAGISVALVLIPQALAYAELAGLPPHVGLLAAALSPIVAAIFASSPYLQTGPTAMTALLTFGVLSGVTSSSSAELVRLAALLALMVGTARLVMGVMRLGGIAYLMSDSVLLGFTTGAAVLIVASQIPKALDVAARSEGVVQDAWWALGNPGQWQPIALLLSVVTIAVMNLGPRVHRLFPGVLIVVVVSTALSRYVADLGSVIGAIPVDFVSPSLDLPWGAADGLLLGAVIIAVVGYAEPASIARSLAAIHRHRWSSNRELVSQGMANVTSAVSGGFPVGGSFSRSALNHVAGATSVWSGAITGAVVLVSLPATALLSELPRAVLGAVVIGAVIKLIRIAPVAELARASVPQVLVAAATFVSTMIFAPRIDRGVLVGVSLSLLLHVTSRTGFRLRVSTERHRDSVTVVPSGTLWFTTAATFERRVRDAISDGETTRIDVDLSAVRAIDFGASARLRRMFVELERAGIDVRATNVSDSSRAAAAAIFPDLTN